MKHGQRYDHMPHGGTHRRAGIYAAERQDLRVRNSWSRRWGLRSVTQGLVLITRQQKSVNMSGWALRALCVRFCLHYRYRYRLSTFGDT